MFYTSQSSGNRHAAKVTGSEPDRAQRTRASPPMGASMALEVSRIENESVMQGVALLGI